MTELWALQASPQDQRYNSDHIPTVFVLNCGPSPTEPPHRPSRQPAQARTTYCSSEHGCAVGMKTDRIRTDITDIVFVFIFMSGFGFEYG
jgi:hypothetical protein